MARKQVIKTGFSVAFPVSLTDVETISDHAKKLSELRKKAADLGFVEVSEPVSKATSIADGDGKPAVAKAT